MTSSMNNNGYTTNVAGLSVLNDNADSVDAVADFNSWLADGIRFNNTNAPTATKTIFALGLKGGQYQVVSFAKSASSGANAINGLNFQPKGLIFLGNDDVTSLDTVTAVPNGSTIGAGTAIGSEQGYLATAAAEAINTQADRIANTGAVFLFPSTSASSSAQTVGTLTAWSATSFTITWSLAGTAERMIALSIGDAIVTSKSPPPTMFRRPSYSIGRRFS
jgi:hypothetical protein